LQSQLTNWEKEKIYLMAKKQEAEKELKAKEAELDVITAPEEKETIESEADSISIEEIKSKITSANEDFDWDADEKKFGNYSDSDREKLEKMYDGTFSSITKGDHHRYSCKC
jgi:small subunit ribosomal protein S1